MKKIILGCFTVSLCLCVINLPVFAAVTLEQKWQAVDLKTPESVLVYRDGKKAFLLVSQVDGEPTAKDGQGGIAKIALNGEVDALDWVTGLNAPKGMAYVDDKLYVADIDTLVEINLKSAEVINRYPVPGATFLNDVTVDSKGVVYVTDTQTQKIHQLQNGQVTEVLSKVVSANGIKAIGSNLIVGAGKQLILVDKQKNQLPIASGFAQDIDGVEPVGKGNFIVSCWPGLIYYVYLDGKIELLLDSQAEKINTADIGFDSTTNLLFVPNFFKNTVTAYTLNQ